VYLHCAVVYDSLFPLCLPNFKFCHHPSLPKMTAPTLFRSSQSPASPLAVYDALSPLCFSNSRSCHHPSLPKLTAPTWIHSQSVTSFSACTLTASSPPSHFPKSRACVGLARTVYMHRIWPYIWWSPSQNNVYTPFI